MEIYILYLEYIYHILLLQIYIFLVSFQGKKKKVSLKVETQDKVKYFQPTQEEENPWIPVFFTEHPEDQDEQKEFKYFLEIQGEIGFTDFPVPFDKIVTRRGRELIRKAFRSDDLLG